MRADPGVFGPVASDPTVSRMISTLAADAPAALSAINTARAAAREQCWERAGASAPNHDHDVHHPLIIDLDATLVTAHSEKEQATPNWKKGFGVHPLCAFADHQAAGTGEPLAIQLRPGNARSNTAADHIAVAEQALAQIPGIDGYRVGKTVVIRTDSTGGTHEFLNYLTKRRLAYSVGFGLTEAIAEIIDSMMNSLDKVYETILLTERAPGVVFIEINRPQRLNAMTRKMFVEMEDAALALDEEDELRVLVVTGAGRAFCAGFDLDAAKDLPAMGAIGMLDQQELAGRALAAIRAIRVPVVAAVNGAAAGGGFSLALAADIRLASPDAKFNAAFVKIGLSAGDLGVSWLLPQLIGPAMAAEICYTGRMVFADEAAELGLVNSVSAPGALLEDVLALAAAIVSNSPGGVQLSKRALHANLEAGSYAAALELENRGQALLTRSRDMPEALAAFREKRDPMFLGE